MGDLGRIEVRYSSGSKRGSQFYIHKYVCALGDVVERVGKIRHERWRGSSGGTREPSRQAA
jgi:hypothetical protein